MKPGRKPTSPRPAAAVEAAAEAAAEEAPSLKTMARPAEVEAVAPIAAAAEKRIVMRQQEQRLLNEIVSRKHNVRERKRSAERRKRHADEAEDLHVKCTNRAAKALQMT